ncbi:hypothetical protein D623_10009860 [Myotis brandtii]|uniref:Uncharacterized protein n=1 Tax=Myotis brandtii TaxID=109478 RepID=S7Q755_MYOBR|nr:hypothetical protein D623_10009860 [Myotis brandtii]
MQWTSQWVRLKEVRAPPPEPGSPCPHSCRRRCDGEKGKLATRGTGRQSKMMKEESRFQNTFPMALRGDEHGFRSELVASTRMAAPTRP